MLHKDLQEQKEKWVWQSTRTGSNELVTGIADAHKSIQRLWFVSRDKKTFTWVQMLFKKLILLGFQPSDKMELSNYRGF
jgi:hypothetical protein